MGNLTAAAKEVTDMLTTLEEGVQEHAVRLFLTNSKLKMFYAILKRTKSYLEAAHAHAREKALEARENVYSALYNDGCD